jgi:hypothetical protein
VRTFEQPGFKSQNSKSLQEGCCRGWFAIETSADSGRAVAKALSAVDSGETKMIIRPTQEAAEVIATISLIMTNLAPGAVPRAIRRLETVEGF